MKKVRFIKGMIIFLIFVIMGLFITKIILDNFLDYNNLGKGENDEETELFETEIKPASETSDGLTAINSAKQYVQYIKEKNIEALINILDKNFVSKNNITRANVIEKLKRYNSDISFDDIAVYSKHSKASLATLYLCDIYESENVEMIVMMDYSNGSFSIIPCEPGSFSLHAVWTPSDDIKLNMYNEYVYQIYRGEQEKSLEIED